MSYAKIHNDFLSKVITKDVAVSLFCGQYRKATIARRLVEHWKIVQRLNRELDVREGKEQTPHLDQANVRRLINIAFLARELPDYLCIDYLTKNGLSVEVARENIYAMKCVRMPKKASVKRERGLDTGKRFCTRCGCQTEARELSARGLCFACNLAAQTANTEQLQAKSGPYYERWLEQTLIGLKRNDDEALINAIFSKPETDKDSDEVSVSDANINPTCAVCGEKEYWPHNHESKPANQASEPDPGYPTCPLDKRPCLECDFYPCGKYAPEEPEKPASKSRPHRGVFLDDTPTYPNCDDNCDECAAYKSGCGAGVLLDNRRPLCP